MWNISGPVYGSCERNFECKVCNKRYKHSGSLYTHKKYKCGRNTKVISCSFSGCDFKSTVSKNLERHLTYAHRKSS